MEDYRIIFDGPPRTIGTADGLTSFVETANTAAARAFLAWEAAGGVPDPAPERPPVLRELSSYAFTMRFTDAERAAIRVAAAADPASQLADLYDRQGRAQTINLDDAEVIAGIALLESAGIIAEGRAAEILA